MKSVSHTVLFCSVLLLPVMTLAANRMVTEDMQSCTKKEECALVSEDCTTSCQTLPLNTAYVAQVKEQVNKQCPPQTDPLPACTVNPPLTVDCINNRCTIGTAYEMNGDAADYQAPKSE